MAVVTSKFDNRFIIQAAVFVVFLFCLLLKNIVILIKLWLFADWYPLLIAGSFFLLTIYFLFRLFRYALVKVTVAPEGLSWKSLITNKLMIIPYKDIVHVAGLREVTGGQISSSSYRTLQIDLITGKQLSFTSIQFENYNELRNAIWEARHVHPNDNTATSTL